MAKQKTLHRIQMTENKKNIIHQLDIKITADIQKALKVLLGGSIRNDGCRD